MAMLVYWRVYIRVPVVTLIIDPIPGFLGDGPLIQELKFGIGDGFLRPGLL